MTLVDFYDVIVSVSILGTVLAGVLCAVYKGPVWYRAKRAAAAEFRREARIREQNARSKW